MNKLSTGEDATLGNYLKLCRTFFGADSAATKFIQKQVDEQGEHEEVIADEGQMLHLLTGLHIKQADGHAVMQKAIEVFGDPEKALKWMVRPNMALGYVKPIDASNEQVMDILVRIEHGVYS